MTTEAPSLPKAGFRIKRIVAIGLEFGIEDPEAAAEKRSLGVQWDWRVSIPEEREIEVYLGMRVRGGKKQPANIDVNFVGEFEVTDVTELSLRQFVQFNAPAMMMPYLREAISSLSSRGPYGTYFVPALNITRMMMDRLFDETIGAGQLRDDPELAALIGILPGEGAS